MSDGLKLQARYDSVLLVCAHIAVCCASLIFIAGYGAGFGFAPAKFHVFYDHTRLATALTIIVAFALISFVFLLAPFSFGYFVGFYSYTMILGYLWLNCFTDLNYDHRLAAASAAVSACAFLLPALFSISPAKQVFVLSESDFDAFLLATLLIAAATIALGAFYNFRVVPLRDMYEFRQSIGSPVAVNYLLTIVSNTLLPFAFAAFVARGASWKATAVLLFLLIFYPITLTKISLLTPAWLVIVLVLSKTLEARTAVILSLFGPIILGLLLLIALKEHTSFFFYTINFRMLAIPSIAMDVYNHFFSRHDLTYFCQISTLKSVMHCPYQEQLSVVMNREYDLGNFNASMFATEGIASVGTFFAPIAAFVCGLVVAVGNRLSANLPPYFVMISGAVLPQVLLNVPLTTVLSTHGGVLLFLLWYITPRSIFQKDSLDRRIDCIGCDDLTVHRASDGS